MSDLKPTASRIATIIKSLVNDSMADNTEIHACLTELKNVPLSRNDIVKLGLPRRKYDRICKTVGFIQPNRAEMIKAKYDSGDTKPARLGQTLSKETCEKISSGIHENWVKNPNGRQLAREKTKERWNNLSKSERDDLLRRAGDGIRKASKEGSKLEHLLAAALQEHGFVNIQHKTGVLPNQDLEFDLYIREIATIIEVDGPTHYNPIWGADRLAKQQRSDAEKAGMAINYKFNFIRLKQTRNLTKFYVKELTDKLIEAVKNIKQNKSKALYLEIE